MASQAKDRDDMGTNMLKQEKSSVSRERQSERQCTDRRRVSTHRYEHTEKQKKSVYVCVREIEIKADKAREIEGKKGESFRARSRILKNNTALAEKSAYIHRYIQVALVDDEQHWYLKV